MNSAARWFALCAISLSSIACATTASHHISWPAYVHCLPQPADIIATVADTLFNHADFQDKLEDLARAKGADTVLCVVDQLVHDWTAPGAAVSPERSAALARGQDFLRVTATQVDRAAK